MSANEQQEAFEKLLGSNLARVFDLVRFAETKNGAADLRVGLDPCHAQPAVERPHAAAGLRRPRCWARSRCSRGRRSCA
jgi:hypothetical protein